MKIKLFGLALVAAMTCASANAVTLTTTLLANSTNNVGLVTTLASGSLTNVTGSAFIYATSVELDPIHVTGVTTRASFEALIVNDPGVVRSNIVITNGAITSSASTELGAVGNKIYVWMESDDLNSYGLYQGINVPSLGSVVMNSATLTDLVGTSTYSATGTSGFQLAFVPEPSAALLGAIGALGLLRRRRI